MTDIVTGDDIHLPVTLYQDDATFSLVTSPVTIVYARLITVDKRTALTSAKLQVSSTTGANWAQSLVVVVFAAADTINLKYTGPALLEIQVNNDGDKSTYFSDVNILQGTIP